jgi:hypothetical protein
MSVVCACWQVWPHSSSDAPPPPLLQKVSYPEDEKRSSGDDEREAPRTKREVLRQTEALQEVSDLVSREQVGP